MTNTPFILANLKKTKDVYESTDIDLTFSKNSWRSEKYVYDSVIPSVAYESNIMKIKMKRFQSTQKSWQFIFAFTRIYIYNHLLDFMFLMQSTIDECDIQNTSMQNQIRNNRTKGCIYYIQAINKEIKWNLMQKLTFIILMMVMR